MGCTVIPSLIILGIQYLLIYIQGIFDKTGSSGIAVVFFSNWVWEGGGGHMFLKIFRQAVFPFIVIITAYLGNTKSRKFDRNLFFSILMYWAAVIIGSLFKEIGPRSEHGNFGWGIPMAYYSMMLYIVPLFFQNWKEYRSNADKVHSIWVYACYGIGLIILLIHVICGFAYFISIAAGGSYWR